MNDINRKIIDSLNRKAEKLVEKFNDETEITDDSFKILNLLQNIEDLKSTIIQNCSNQFDLECKEIKAIPTTTLPPITDGVQPLYGCPFDS